MICLIRPLDDVDHYLSDLFTRYIDHDLSDLSVRGRHLSMKKTAALLYVAWAERKVRHGVDGIAA